jgi:hypothetical protein
MARTLVSGRLGGSAAQGATIGVVDAVQPRLALAGAELLVLLRDWPAWTHRRVEHVTFLEEDFVRRRISVDLTVLPRAPQGWEGVGGPGARLLPLGLLRKGRLAEFDLRQEGGEAVPLLTSAQNGPLATEVLAAAAQLLASGPRTEPVPDGLRASLRTIAAGEVGEAIEAWRGLGVAGEEQGVERDWRETLAADGWFMELALNLARNFLVLASVVAAEGERRVLKMSYVRRLGAETVPRRAAGVYAVRAARAQATATLTLSAVMAVPGVARPQPLSRVAARVVGQPEGRTVAWLATDRQGEAVAFLEPGLYRVEVIDAPRGARLASPPAPVTLGAGEDRSLALTFEPSGAARPHRPRVPRAVAPRALRLALPVPGVRFCASAHVELEAPDGLRVTRAELHELQRPTDEPAGVAARSDVVVDPVQRTHLYLAATGHDRSGSCDVWLRPRQGTILAPATLVAAVATILLGLVAWRLEDLTATVGSAGSLLLFVPGIASAYVARPREDPFTSRALLTLRAWALGPAFACLTAAATLLLARPTLHVRGVPVIGEATVVARPLIVVAALLALVSFGVLVATWYAAASPPESRAEASPGAAGPATM